MSNEQDFITRNLFKVKVYKSDGQSFEDLFCEVMEALDNRFEKVKPQGTVGDRKNDGFISEIGHYYQVYAPEDLGKNVSKAVSKLVTDFEGLYINWNDKTAIRKFFFTLNDKYKGKYPSLYDELNKLKEKYPAIEFDNYSANDLERDFLRLSESDQMQIVGFIPNAVKINSDFNSLNEVIEYLITLEEDIQYNDFIPDPNFDEKIKFNSLSEVPKRYLEHGNIHSHSITEYFKYKASTKVEIQKKFIFLYQEGLKVIPDEEDNKSDKVFYFILDSASPNNKKLVKDAVLLLMSYYFEYCDIFEAPKNQ